MGLMFLVSVLSILGDARRRPGEPGHDDDHADVRHSPPTSIAAPAKVDYGTGVLSGAHTGVRLGVAFILMFHNAAALGLLEPRSDRTFKGVRYGQFISVQSPGDPRSVGG